MALPRETIAYFGPRFGHDFNGVRVHVGGDAAHAARTLHAVCADLGARFGADFDSVRLSPSAAAHRVSEGGADAVTVGEDIAFGESAYQPTSAWGRELIAHELAHVVQQRGGTGDPPLGDAAAYEQQADKAAQGGALRPRRARHSPPRLSVLRRGSPCATSAVVSRQASRGWESSWTGSTTSR